MECDEIAKLIDAWVDGQLPAAEAERVERHVNHCPACRPAARSAQRIVAALDALPAIHAPAALSRRTVTAFRAGLERPGIRQWWQELGLAMRGAVCGAVLAGLVFGTVLGTRIPSVVSNAPHPYHVFYDSKGIVP